MGNKTSFQILVGADNNKCKIDMLKKKKEITNKLSLHRRCAPSLKRSERVFAQKCSGF